MLEVGSFVYEFHKSAYIVEQTVKIVSVILTLTIFFIQANHRTPGLEFRFNLPFMYDLKMLQDFGGNIICHILKT